MASPAQKIQFPFNGQNIVTGYDAQPPATTPDCLNVRGFDPIADRLRGGRRPGLSKWVDDRINGANGIQCMHPTTLGTPFTSTGLGDVTAIDDDLTTVTAVYPGPSSNNYIYTYKRNSDNRMRHADDFGNTTETGTSALGFANGGNTNNVYSIAGLRWRMAEDKIEAYWDANGAHSSDTRGTRGNSFGRAVYLKMGLFFQDGVCAYLVRTADSTVRLRIVDIGSSSETTIAESADIALSGGTTFNASLYISLELIGNTLTATTHWADEYNGGAGAAGWNPDAPTTVTTDIRTIGDGGNFTNDHTSNFRAGIGMFGNFNFSTEPYKWVNRVLATVYKPAGKSVARSMRRQDDSSANNFFVPANLTAVYLDQSVGGAPAGQVTGFDSSPSRTGQFANVPVIDDANDILTGNNVSNAADAVYVTQTDEPTTREAIQVEAVVPSAKSLMFVTRVSDNFQNLMLLELDFATTVGLNDTILQADQIFNDYNISYYVNGSRTLQEAITLTHDIIMHFNDEIIFSDDGTDITVQINGMTISTVTPNPTQAAAVGDTNRTGLAIEASTGTTTHVGAAWLETVSDEDLPVASTAETSLLVAAGGTVKRVKDLTIESVTNGEGALNDQLFQVAMQSAFGRTFMLDGIVSKQYNLATNSITTWTATSGTLPARARLMALYRGRIVLSGVVDEPQNWFMSRLGDPFDWDYFPAVPDATDPVAGNNSEAGLVGDVITALIPFSDDAMLMGGQNSIWQMTGDPAAGGAIDLVSDITGIAFGKAWAKDPNNTLYFMGNDGIYRFRFGEPPQNISENRVDRVFKEIDLDFNRIYLEWDFIRDGLIVMIVPTNPSTANTAYFWDARTDSWWPDQYAATQGPVFMFPYDGPKAEDQEILFGGRDGYIRKIDDDAANDDGTAITSRVRFAPLLGGDPSREIVLHELYPVLAAGSGDVDLKVYSGQTAEDVVTSSTARFSRTISAGRNASLRQRVRGAGLLVELSQTGSSRWAMESLAAVIKPGGKVRRR